MKKNRITLYTAIIIIIIVILVVISLIIVWSPSEKKNESVDGRKKVYSYIENTNFKEKTFQIYKSEVDRLLMPVNTSQLYEKSNKEFLESNNLTKGNYKNYLEENNLLGNNINFKSYIVVENGDTYVYRVTYDIVDGNNRVLVKDRIVNIIEEKPYVYTLSFETESLEVLKHNANQTHEGITFSINNIENKGNSVKFEIRFTNNNEENVRVDFDDINNVILGLENGKQIKMAATVISADEEILTKGSSLRKEAFFAVSLEEQGLIKYIKFNKVTIGNDEKTIKIEF